MKLNWAERWVVNNPFRALEQHFQIRWLKKAMPLRPQSRILEVGCGRGAGAGLILKEFDPSMLYAMDLDEDMIQRAGRYLSPEQQKRVSLYTGDATRLPHGSGSMDAVFGFGVLHHVPEWRKALAEIVRVLKPGGVYYLEEIYPSVYQNRITRHILLHPTQDRFHSRDLHQAFSQQNLSVHRILEARQIGILAVLVKEG